MAFHIGHCIFNVSLFFDIIGQTLNHRFCAMSALISAASSEKLDRYTKLRASSGTMNIHQQSSPLSHHKYRQIHYHIGEQNNSGQQIEFSAKSNQFEKTIKNESK